MKKNKGILKNELAFFRKEQARFVKDHYGKLVVIVGDKVLGFYDSDLEAYLDTKKKELSKPFLIRKCVPPEEEPTFTLHTLGSI